MSKKIIAIHSFRQSVGKSTLSANLAVLLQQRGKRVGLIDTDFHGPSAHLFFGLDEDAIQTSLNAVLWENADPAACVHDLTPNETETSRGKLFLVPASPRISDIMKSLHAPLNFERFHAVLAAIEKEFSLDFILLDSRAGLNEDTLKVMAAANTLLIVLHPDAPDLQGSAVIESVAKKLAVPSIRIVLNDTSPVLDAEAIALQLKQTFHTHSNYILSHTDELLALGSSQPFVLAYPHHPLTLRMKEIARKL